MLTNKTIENMLNHRTIRKWRNKEIPEEIIETLSEVAMRTSTSEGMQLASIIKVKDKEKREKLREVSTQKYLVDAPELWIFVADGYRNHRIFSEQSSERNYTNDADKFFQSFTDAALMAQNVAIAAESLGLGIVFFGSILNDPEKTINILELPERTMPVVGLGIGYPDQKPQLKPRMNKKYRIFTDKYKKFDNYREQLKDYDLEMAKYYDLRNDKKPLDKFTEQVYDKYKNQRIKRSKIIRIAEKQGYEF
ncbi:nitroreductase family protein [Helcococcus kunzii]